MDSSAFTLTAAVNTIMTPPSSPVVSTAGKSIAFGAGTLTAQKRSIDFVFSPITLETKSFNNKSNTPLTPPTTPVLSSSLYLGNSLASGRESESYMDGGNRKRRRVVNDIPSDGATSGSSSSSSSSSKSYRRRHADTKVPSKTSAGPRRDMGSFEVAPHPSRPSGIVLRLRIPESMKLQSVMDKLSL